MSFSRSADSLKFLRCVTIVEILALAAPIGAMAGQVTSPITYDPDRISAAPSEHRGEIYVEIIGHFDANTITYGQGPGTNAGSVSADGTIQVNSRAKPHIHWHVEGDGTSECKLNKLHLDNQKNVFDPNFDDEGDGTRHRHKFLDKNNEGTAFDHPFNLTITCRSKAGISKNITHDPVVKNPGDGQ